MATGGYTIGEVLNQLKEDFEDITISKIRFLESEGLVFPDRTESGYRKFSDDDVNRLRFILTAQRDHYLPLKVIREQLDRLDAGQLPVSTPPDDGSGGATPETGVGAVGQPMRIAEITSALDAAMTHDAAHLLASDDASIVLSIDELSGATGLTATEVRSLREAPVEVVPPTGDANVE